MKDHQIAQLVNELRGIANQYAGTEQLREHLSQAVVEAVKKTPDPKVVHVYHVVAEQILSPGVMNRFDGIARVDGTVETVECYRHLKELVAPQMTGNPDAGRISITSLSYLGVSHA